MILPSFRNPPSHGHACPWRWLSPRGHRERRERILTSSQGCCISRTSGEDSPYPDSTTPTSSHAINQPAPEPPADPTQASPPTQTPRRRRRAQQPLDQHINKPLRPHAWTSRNRGWARASLDRERADFFDTRVTGRPEIWQALHAALGVLWGGDDEDGAGGLATAQTILDAAEITLPTGDLAHGAYDSFGNYYAFHEWIVSDPVNIVEDEDEDEDEDGEGRAVDHEDAKTVPPFEAVDEEDEEEEEDVLRRREEKGKAVAVKDLVAVFARLSENGRDIKVSVSKSDPVRSVARKVLVESGVCPHSPHSSPQPLHNRDRNLTR